MSIEKFVDDLEAKLKTLRAERGAPDISSVVKRGLTRQIHEVERVLTKATAKGIK